MEGETGGRKRQADLRELFEGMIEKAGKEQDIKAAMGTGGIRRKWMEEQEGIGTHEETGKEGNICKLERKGLRGKESATGQLFVVNNGSFKLDSGKMMSEQKLLMVTKKGRRIIPEITKIPKMKENIKMKNIKFKTLQHYFTPLKHQNLDRLGEDYNRKRQGWTGKDSEREGIMVTEKTSEPPGDTLAGAACEYKCHQLTQVALSTITTPGGDHHIWTDKEGHFETCIQIIVLLDLN